MDLKRDIYQELLAWKRRSNHKVLELEGARQVGKTYILEKFVYLELVQRIRRQEIAGQAPWFATDKKTSGELDFYVRSRMDNRNYGIEVKRGKNQPATANALLERGKLRQDRTGGLSGRDHQAFPENGVHICGS